EGAPPVKADPQDQRRLLDLQAIDTALAQLAHKRRTLPELAELDRLARELSALEDGRVRAQVAVDDLDRDISRFERDVDQVRVRAAGRRPLVSDLPADLVALYERIREQNAGIGAALLRAGRCGGCRLELSGSERSRVRSAPPDEVVRCEECRRILVRTEESGL